MSETDSNSVQNSADPGGCPGVSCSSFCCPTEKCCITDDGKCDALREVALSVAGYIRKPYRSGEIASIIESGDYSAELMMQHLLLLVTNAIEHPTKGAK